MLDKEKTFTYKPSEQQLNKVVEIVLVMVMVMDKKMLLMDKQPLVCQFLDQQQLNVFDVVQQQLLVAAVVVEHIVVQQ